MRPIQGTNAAILLAFFGGVLATSGIFFFWYSGHQAPAAQLEPVASQVAETSPEPERAVETPPAREVSPPVPARPRARRASRRTPQRTTRRPDASTAANGAATSVTPAPPPTTPEASSSRPVLQTASNQPPPADQPRPPNPYKMPDLPAPNPPEPVTVTLAAGTIIPIRLGETIDSSRSSPGDAFRGTLTEPLSVDGWVIAERGARVLGKVVDVRQSGRLKGLASITLQLTSLITSDGQRINLQTASFVHEANTSKKKDAEKVGIGVAIGAVIGAIAGGGKGAAIGAATGGAAGAGTVAATRGDAAVLESETRLSFALDQPVTITQRQPQN